MAENNINKSLSKLKRGVKLILKNNDELVYMIKLIKPIVHWMPHELIVTGLDFQSGSRKIKASEIKSIQV